MFSKSNLQNSLVPGRAKEIMSIDKAISYEEVERNGDKVKRKKIAYKPYAVSNGYDHYPNVIPIGEIPHEKPLVLFSY